MVKFGLQIQFHMEIILEGEIHDFKIFEGYIFPHEEKKIK